MPEVFHSLTDKIVSWAPVSSRGGFVHVHMAKLAVEAADGVGSVVKQDAEVLMVQVIGERGGWIEYWHSAINGLAPLKTKR